MIMDLTQFLTLKAYPLWLERNVRPQVFLEGDLVWKQIQPARSNQSKFSPKWEGPFGLKML